MITCINAMQGCQIFRGAICIPKWENTPNDNKIYQTGITIYVPNSKINRMAMKYTNIFHSKAFQNLKNRDFWYANKPSGNPGAMSKP
jgi:hypothetical protein